MKYALPLCLFALALAACTQQPAPVELHGQEDFSRNHIAEPAVASISVAAPSLASESVAASAPAVQTASISSVSSTDLAPPTAAPAEKPQAENMPFATAKPEAPKPQASAAPAPAPKAKPVKLAGTAPVVLHRTLTNVAYIWPVEGGKVIGHFGPQGAGRANDGISIAADSGEPVYAVAPGMVSFTGDQLKNYGHMVLITHKNGMHSTYAHLSKVAVKQQQHVKQGDIIGYVGSSGGVARPQLYFSMRNGTKPVNPEHYLSSAYASN